MRDNMFSIVRLATFIYITIVHPFRALSFSSHLSLFDHQNMAQTKLRQSVLLLFLCGLTLSTARGFSITHYRRRQLAFSSPATLLTLRGGEQDQEQTTQQNLSTAMAIPLANFGKAYASSLDARPILTKSVTAGCIFAVSDYLAQRLESSGSRERKINPTRLLTSAAVGLFYFGPAAHAWYNMIFQLLPGTSLVSTLQKAVMGQLFFGPSFTCIFFATSLMQSGNFTIANWLRKIRQDLPGAWLAGASFWPLVDLVSFSVISKEWIPLFVNMCSLVWTIYLSSIANRGSKSS
jgi:hypothetical protein